MVSILVTAGPTREYLDDVRFLANGSSGRMGCALAAAAARAGHRVFLVLGPVEVAPPAGVELVPVVSALDMQAAAERLFPQCQVAVAAAAVADYRPAHRQIGKPPRGRERVVLELVPNPDIVAGLGTRKGDRVVVGFALEAAAAGFEAAVARARKKLEQKQLDLVVVNLTDAVGSGASQVAMLYADGGRTDLPRQDKPATAEQIMRAAVELWQARQHKR
ncbi:MAG TPA: phosphopantothenoylcysteine decarboxylase [Planctomycetota bacterium]|nr:phosphopantothenoylcysteine decarboxylase [Planctomycetota bacterium]